MYIYKITNLISKKVYIGQTIHQISERIKGHFCYKTKPKSYISKAIKKHGKENFIVECIDTALDQIELDSKEIFWIRTYLATNSKFGYNLRQGGNGGKLHEETKIKIRKKRALQIIEKGKKHNFSKEGLESMRDKNKLRKPMKDKKHSLESRKKMSEKRKGVEPWNKGLKTKDLIGKKVSNGRKKYFKNEGVVWNKGLTKETSEFVKKGSEKTGKSKKGKPSWNKGVPMKDFVKISLAEIVICPYCGKSGGKSGMMTHHFNNCKLKK